MYNVTPAQQNMCYVHSVSIASSYHLIRSVELFVTRIKNFHQRKFTLITWLHSMIADVLSKNLLIANCLFFKITAWSSLQNIPWSLDLVQINTLIPWYLILIPVVDGSTSPMKVTTPPCIANLVCRSSSVWFCLVNLSRSFLLLRFSSLSEMLIAVHLFHHTSCVQPKS